MNETEIMNLNPLGYIFHSQPVVIPVKRRNLVHINQSDKIIEAYRVTRVTRVHWRYDHDKLFELVKDMKSDYWFSVLDPSTVKIIRRYRLNKWGHRGERRHKLLWRQMGVNTSMLVPVPIKNIPLKDKNSACLCMSLLNAQSIWDKDYAIVDYILNKNINIVIITESCLWHTKEDVCRFSTSELNTGLFSAIPSNRQDRTMGGILLVHKKSYKADLIEEVLTCSFQAAKFKVHINRSNITLLAIYHPPYSAVNPVIEKIFIEDFTEWIFDQPFMSEHWNKLLMLGDFNIHVHDAFDENASNFMDIIMALGCEQHIHFPTHKAGNTLDLVITELGSKWEVTKCSPGPFWLDHCAADFVVKLPMYSTVQEVDTIHVRKMCELDHERLIYNIDISDLLSINDLSELVGAIKNNMQKTLNSQAPFKKKQLPVSTRVPWFTNELKQQKQTVRYREWIWRQYRAEHQWTALKTERKKYIAMIRRAKTHTLSSQIIDAGKHTKKLCSLNDWK